MDSGKCQPEIADQKHQHGNGGQRRTAGFSGTSIFFEICLQLLPMPQEPECCKGKKENVNAPVGKTSAGAASWLPVARVSNLVSAMETLKEHGVWIYGTDAAGASYTQPDFTGGTAFVIGSEGFGMNRLVGETCDAMLSLPMRGKVNSLNASVAAGIFLYEAVRQRMEKEA